MTFVSPKRSTFARNIGGSCFERKPAKGSLDPRTSRGTKLFPGKRPVPSLHLRQPRESPRREILFSRHRARLDLSVLRLYPGLGTRCNGRAVTRKSCELRRALAWLAAW